MVPQTELRVCEDTARLDLLRGIELARVESDSTKKPLDDLLKRARDGLIQLPDFQRGWVWDDEGLRGLLASISRSFPVGAIMTLQAGGEVKFKPRPIEGAPPGSATVAPESLQPCWGLTRRVSRPRPSTD